MSFNPTGHSTGYGLARGPPAITNDSSGSGSGSGSSSSGSDSTSFMHWSGQVTIRPDESRQVMEIYEKFNENIRAVIRETNDTIRAGNIRYGTVLITENNWDNFVSDSLYGTPSYAQGPKRVTIGVNFMDLSTPSVVLISCSIEKEVIHNHLTYIVTIEQDWIDKKHLGNIDALPMSPHPNPTSTAQYPTIPLLELLYLMIIRAVIKSNIIYVDVRNYRYEPDRTDSIFANAANERHKRIRHILFKYGFTNQLWFLQGKGDYGLVIDYEPGPRIVRMTPECQDRYNPRERKEIANREAKRLDKIRKHKYPRSLHSDAFSERLVTLARRNDRRFDINDFMIYPGVFDRAWHNIFNNILAGYNRVILGQKREKERREKEKAEEDRLRMIAHEQRKEELRREAEEIMAASAAAAET